jgi:hypothetical protein
VRRNTASVEIPSGLSTTGESPLYDLRSRWTQSRHIATFDLTSVARSSDAPGPQNCRTSRRAEDPVELTEYATFKEIHYLFGQRVWKCLGRGQEEIRSNRQRPPRCSAQVGHAPLRPSSAKVLIPQPDGIEWFRRNGADYIIGLSPHLLTCLGRCRRHGHYDLGGMLLS